MIETSSVKEVIEAGAIKSFGQIFVTLRYSRAKLVRETGISQKRLSLLIYLPQIMTPEECKAIAAHFQVTQKSVKRLAKS